MINSTSSDPTCHISNTIVEHNQVLKNCNWDKNETEINIVNEGIEEESCIIGNPKTKLKKEVNKNSTFAHGKV